MPHSLPLTLPHKAPDDAPRSLRSQPYGTIPRHLVRHGIPAALHDQAAALYWQAFGREIVPLPSSATRGEALIRHALRPEQALITCDPAGQLAALVGIRDETGGLLDPDAAAFARSWGRLCGGVMRLATGLHRSGPATSDLVLDGLVVRPDLRGQGYGQALVTAATALAHRRGYSGLRAEVALSNTPARALYQSLGFQPAGQSRIGWPWSGRAEIMRLGHPAERNYPPSPPPEPAA